MSLERFTRSSRSPCRRRGAAIALALPEPLRRERGALRQRTELRPADFAMDAAAHAAIGAGDDVLAPDDRRPVDEPPCHELGMLDDVGGVADDARHEDRPGRELHLL